MADVITTHAVRDDISSKIEFKAGATTQTVIGGQDEMLAVIVHNTDAAAAGILVKAGNGMRASIGDLLVSVPAGEMRVLSLDSMRFKNLSGANRGKIEIRICKSGDAAAAFVGAIANIKIAAIHM